MTKNERVEQEIRRLVPRLQELSFGCMLKTPTNKIVTFSHSVAHAASKKKVKDYDGSIFTTPTKEYTDYICIKKMEVYIIMVCLVRIKSSDTRLTLKRLLRQWIEEG